MRLHRTCTGTLMKPLFEDDVPVRDSDFIQFWHTLLRAEEELQWGTDILAISSAAQALRKVRPSSPLIAQLEAKIARLKTSRRLMGRQHASPLPAHRSGV